MIRLIRGGIISGRVTDSEGHALPGAVVFPMVAMGPDNDFLPLRSAVHEGRSNRRGEYRISNLPPGRYAVAAAYAQTEQIGGVAPYTGAGAMRIFSIAGADEYSDVNFSVGAGQRSKIAAAVEGADDAYVSASLVPLASPGVSMARGRAIEHGAIEFAGVPPGDYDLLVAAIPRSTGLKEPVSSFARQRIAVRGQDVTGVSMVPRNGLAAAFVLDPAGPYEKRSCAPQASVMLTPLEDWPYPAGRQIDLTAGKEVIAESLPPARYLVTASQPGGRCYTTAPALLDLTDADPKVRPLVPVRMTPAASLTGRVLGAPSRVAGSAVILVPVNVDSDDRAEVRLAIADARGRFSLDGLRPGRYRVAAEPAESRWRAPAVMRQAIEIELPGGQTDLELPLVASGGTP